MNKFRTPVLLLVVALLFVFVAGGCGTNTSTGTPSEQTAAANNASAESTAGEAAETKSVDTTAKKIVIGLALSSQQEERWVKEAAFFKAAVEKLGATALVQDANNDEIQQSNQIENLISQKVDAIVIVAVNNKTIGASVASIKSAGIPVMAYSRLVKDTPYDCFIGFDVPDIGRSIAKAAVAKVPKGNYFITNGDEKDINSKFYRDGMEEILKPYVDKGDIKIVSDQWAENWLPEKALAITENALTNNSNKVDAILCSNDGMAGGVISALKAQKLDGKVYVGGSDGETAALQRIVEGSQSSTLLFPSQGMAELGAKAAVELAKGKTTPTDAKITIDAGSVKIPAIYVSTKLITKDNINADIIKTGIAKVEEVYKNVPKDQWPQ
jgi:D-xylose transport system substrate-binding protein